MHKLQTHIHTQTNYGARSALKLHSHNLPMIHRCFCCCSSTKTAAALNAAAPLQFIGILWCLLFFQLSHTHTHTHAHKHTHACTAYINNNVKGLRMLGAACFRSRHRADLCQWLCCTYLRLLHVFNVYFLHPTSVFFNVFYFDVVVRVIYVLVTYHKYFKVTCNKSCYKKLVEFLLLQFNLNVLNSQ